MRILGIVLVLSIGIPILLSAQTLRPRYGLYGAYDLNQHSADFRQLPGVPNCCPRFEEGSGTGPAFGALVELPLTRRFFLNLRLGYMSHDATLSAEEPTTVIVGGTPQQGAFTHTVDASLSTFGIEPMVSWNATGTSGLHVHLGFRLATLMKNAFSQQEVVSQPANSGTFIDSNGNDTRSRIRNEYSGDIPNASTLAISGAVGVSYDLPLNADHTMFLVPEVLYFYGLSQVVDGLDWKMNAIRPGLAIKYWPKLESKPIIADTILIRDTTVRTVAGLPSERVVFVKTTKTDKEIEDPINRFITTTVREHYERQIPKVMTLTANVQAFGVRSGKELPIAQIKVEEFLSSRLHPLLNYIFFEEGESALPARYKTIGASETKQFTINGLFGKGTLDIYHEMLNVVGYRMRQIPDATITVIGCNSGPSGKETTALSRQRAETVVKYLRDVWGVAESRITVESRDLPEKPSNPRTPDGMAENRRVEIRSNKTEILEPIFATDILRVTDPPLVRLKPNVTSSEGINTWTMKVTQQGKVLKEFSGKGAVPVRLDWNTADDPASIPVAADALLISMQVLDAIGNDRIVHSTLPVELITLQKKRTEKIGDKEVDIFNLILFDFDKAELNAANQRIIDFVKSKLSPTSQISITGYTDRTGDEAYNKKLSADRAEATRRGLGRPDAFVSGVGEEQLLYPNDHPEGRFYCRTVQIVAEKTIR